jgi:hypothetical protein
MRKVQRRRQSCCRDKVEEGPKHFPRIRKSTSKFEIRFLEKRALRRDQNHELMNEMSNPTLTSNISKNQFNFPSRL